MEDDWLMKQLQILPKQMPTLKQTNNEPLIDVEDQLTGEMRSIPLRQLLLEQLIFLKLNEAENLLFATTSKLSDSQLLEIADWFYGKLASLNDEKLHQGNFSRAEISQGRQDIQRLLNPLATKSNKDT